MEHSDSKKREREREREREERESKRERERESPKLKRGEEREREREPFYQVGLFRLCSGGAERGVEHDARVQPDGQWRSVGSCDRERERGERGREITRKTERVCGPEERET